MKNVSVLVGVIFLSSTLFGKASAQSDQGFYNEKLIAQRVSKQQSEAIWSSDQAQCLSEGQMKAAQMVPLPGLCDARQDPSAYKACNDNREYAAQRFKSTGKSIVLGCLASRGWSYGVPPAPLAANPPIQAKEQYVAPRPVESLAIAKDEAPKLKATGTAFFVNMDGYLLTNAHVVQGCDKLLARASNGVEFPLMLASLDSGNDLALLKSNVRGLSVIFRRGSAPLGERIVVFGYPLAGTLSDTGNLTSGSVSSLAGIAGDSGKYQISAPIQPGNSGGPVFDESGLVIGVVQSKLSVAKAFNVTGDIPQNVNFAIKSSIALNLLETQGIVYLDKPKGKERKASAIAEDATKLTVNVGCYKS